MRIASSEPVRIDLDNGEWIDIKKSLSFADVTAVTEGVSVQGADEAAKIALPLIALAVVAWHLLDDSGQEIPLTKENVFLLDTATVQQLIPKLTEQYFAEKKSSLPSNESSSSKAE